jgi:hypothetical protein
MGTKSLIFGLKIGLFLASVVILMVSCSLPPGNSTAVNSDGAEQKAISATLPGKSGQESSSQFLSKPWFEGWCEQLPFTPLTNFEIQQVPDLDEPAPRVPFQDPVFGTCLVRVTDRSSDLSAGDISQGMKNEYSRVQSFNADGTRLGVFTTDGNWYVYDAFSLQPLGQIPIEREPRWDAADPDLLYYNEETRLVSYRISTGQKRTIHEFADDFPGKSLSAVWTKFEGSPTKDVRYWGLMAENQDWMTVAFLIYDLEVDQIVAVRETPPSEIDSVAISPKGNYFLAFYDNYCEHGQIGSDHDPCGLMVYDRKLENGRGLLRIVGHSDLSLDAQGKEVLVYQDIDQDELSMLDLSNGVITPLLPIDFSHSALGFHFSGRALLMPGWVLVSTSNGSRPSSTWMDDQIFALELKPNGRVVRFAHTHSIFDEHIEHDYWAEPHASANQDFTQIVFTSNWGRSGSDQVDMYMIKLPKDWVSQVP